MQKLGLSQSLTQKLSPQQIQFIKLLQVPTAELDTRIEEELEVNPALEEGKEDSAEEKSAEENPADDFDEGADDEVNVEDYLRDDDYSGYKMQGDGENFDDKDMPIPTTTSLNDQLMAQLGFLGLDERQYIIGEQLVGSIESDGYIRRELEAIVNDMAFAQNVETDIDEIEEVLRKVQKFDPPGIAARNLQECLLIQLERKVEHSDVIYIAIRIIHDCFDEFTKKHYTKIQKKLGISDPDLLKFAVDLITKLNPKPGGSSGGLVKTQYLFPDFLLTNDNGKLELTLNSKNNVGHYKRFDFRKYFAEMKMCKSLGQNY